jgi:UDP-N-acetylmuramoyl-tripeptide--D-alanyl-D-alanine ligase
LINLRDLILALTNEENTSLDVPISNVVIDSRQAVQGSLFIALPGERVNGHDFVESAFLNGASLALVDQPMLKTLQVIDLRSGYFNPSVWKKFQLPLCLRVENTLLALQKLATYWRESHPVRTIGITGSVGKTSTKELTASLLSAKYDVLKNAGNRNNEIGLPLTLLELENHHKCAVLEMGFYIPGEIQTLCNIAHPHVGVITNIGTVHAERAGSQEAIARGKAELVRSLPGAPQGVAVLNMDDPWVRAMAGQTQAQLLTIGVKNSADLMASEIMVHGLEGISCKLTYKGEQHQIQSQLLGEFSAYTILFATAVALVEGLDWEMIKLQLSRSRIDLRMRHYRVPFGATILDDTYNASPESTLAALQLLARLEGRRVAILGDMLELGPYEETGHAAVGQFSVKAADLLILIGERSKFIKIAAETEGFPTNRIHWFPNSHQAAVPTANLLSDGDVVLVKGSNSMHMDRIIKAIKERA